MVWTGLNWSELVSRFSDTMSEEEEEIGSASSLMGRVKLARQEALRKKLEAEMTDQDKLKEKMWVTVGALSRALEQVPVAAGVKAIRANIKKLCWISS